MAEYYGRNAGKCTMDGMGFGRYRLASAIEVRLIIRSPGLAYALNDFLEVLSHLQREYEETRTTKKLSQKKSGWSQKIHANSQISQWFC